MFKTVSKNWKYPAVEEGEGSASRNKQREDLIKFKFKILYDNQSGFRKNYSTYTCLSFLNDKISKGFDDDIVTRMILIDLQKTFDMITMTYF